MNAALTETALTDLLLSIADDKLILGHRNSDWTGLAPILEEDIAFSALAQDDIAHAQALYEIIAARAGTTADALAFGRAPADFRCAQLVERHDGFDWAVAIARQFYLDQFDAMRLERLSRSSDTEVAALAKRLHAEQAAHVEHSSGWMLRLGAEPSARARVQSAMTELAADACMLFEPIDGEGALGDQYPQGGDFDDWSAAIHASGFDVELSPPSEQPGGRRGVHRSELTELLDEMCEVYRVEPEAAW